MTQFQFETITIKTKACIYCYKSSDVTVLKSDYQRWQSGALIQHAFPEMTKDQRELLNTGIHSDCWDSMFKDDEEID